MFGRCQWMLHRRQWDWAGTWVNCFHLHNLKFSNIFIFDLRYIWVGGTGGGIWTHFTRSFCATNSLKQTYIVRYKKINKAILKNNRNQNKNKLQLLKINNIHKNHTTVTVFVVFLIFSMQSVAGKVQKQIKKHIYRQQWRQCSVRVWWNKTWQTIYLFDWLLKYEMIKICSTRNAKCVQFF